MQIVIDIPDGCYEELKNARFPAQDTYRLVAWIKTGIPLPEGHGRLIDADALKNFFEEHAYPVRYDRNSIEQGMSMTGIETCLEESATIVEAYKEGENGD